MNISTTVKASALSLAALFGVLASAQDANAAITETVDFETPDVAQTTLLGSSFASDGFNFVSALGNFSLLESDSDYYTGSQALFTESLGDTITITFNSGEAFTPSSIDLSGITGNSPLVFVTGYFEDGGTFSQSIFANDALQTYNFDSGFSDVVQLDLQSLFAQNVIADNFTATPVPAPGAAALFAGGLGLIARRRRP